MEPAQALFGDDKLQILQGVQHQIEPLAHLRIGGGGILQHRPQVVGQLQGQLGVGGLAVEDLAGGEVGLVGLVAVEGVEGGDGQVPLHVGLVVFALLHGQAPVGLHPVHNGEVFVIPGGQLIPVQQHGGLELPVPAHLIAQDLAQEAHGHIGAAPLDVGRAVHGEDLPVPGQLAAGVLHQHLTAAGGEGQAGVVGLAGHLAAGHVRLAVQGLHNGPDGHHGAAPRHLGHGVGELDVFPVDHHADLSGHAAQGGLDGVHPAALLLRLQQGGYLPQHHLVQELLLGHLKIRHVLLRGHGSGDLPGEEVVGTGPELLLQAGVGVQVGLLRRGPAEVLVRRAADGDGVLRGRHRRDRQGQGHGRRQQECQQFFHLASSFLCVVGAIVTPRPRRGEASSAQI